MDLTYYIDRIKFLLTGDVLETELTDESIGKLVNFSLQEINRYYDSTQLVQVPLSGNETCIDLAKVEKSNKIKISSISNIYRNKANGVAGTDSRVDPMAVAQWNMANNFYGYGTNRWSYNYMAYTTTQQIMNTLSTDLDFKEDKLGKKLYVNFSGGSPTEIVIEYVPKIEKVEEVVGEYWIDILCRMSLAYTKLTLGKIRTRYTQSNALWSQDGDKMLEEGTNEINALRERLQSHANFMYPID